MTLFNVIGQIVLFTTKIMHTLKIDFKKYLMYTFQIPRALLAEPMLYKLIYIS